MEGSGDTCAIVCISGSSAPRRHLVLHVCAEIYLVSRLDSERHPRLASLVRDAASIRLFHLQSIEGSEGELCCAKSCELPHNRPLSPQQLSVAFRGAESTRSDDRPSKIHYHEGSSSMGLGFVYILRQHRTAICNIATVYFKGCVGSRMRLDVPSALSSDEFWANHPKSLKGTTLVRYIILGTRYMITLSFRSLVFSESAPRYH